MLLRFSVTNHLSLRDPNEISFVATALKDRVGSTVPSRFAKHGVLPVIALYGANASGKSNMLDALWVLKRLVINSFSNDEDEFENIHRPFALDETSSRLPTTFCLDFLLDDIRHQFGVSFDRSGVREEWLYAFPKLLQQTLYHRTVVDDEESFSFGRSLTGATKQIQSITKRSALFISAATQAGHPLLSNISDYFRKKVSFESGVGPAGSSHTADILNADPELLSAVEKHLATADTGISKIGIEKKDLPKSKTSEMQEFAALIKRMSGGKDFDFPDHALFIKLGHDSADGKVRFLEFADESAGTRYLISLLPPMLKALRTGGVLALDEITTSLHTLLSKKLVHIFMDADLNRLGAQLIFSTHDTNLLAPSVLRRDSVWFAEKSKAGVSIIFPLIDIKTKNTDNIERGYVEGRFGAIPFVRSSATVSDE